MRSFPLVAVLLVVAASANAQTQSRPDPPDRSKTAMYALRVRDEVAQRQLLDSAHVALHTASFREALRNYAPMKNAELGLNWGEFITATGRVFVALQLAPPAAVGLRDDAKVTAFGEVRNAAGRVLYDFEEPVRVEASKGDPFIERTLIDDVGGATGTFGIARGKEIIALGQTTFDYETPDKSSPGLSPLLVSNNVYNLPAIQKPLDPFAFGGTKVVPKPDRAFRGNDEIWLFTELRNPSLGSDKLPKLTAAIDVEGSGKKVKGVPMPIDASPLKGVENHYGLGTTVDLSRFPRGEYKVKLTVRDEIAKQAYQRETTIRLVE